MSHPPQRHLVDVWNPSYASDAMTAHLAVLLDAAQRAKGTDDEPYVWWGKVRSPNREQELRHLPWILEIAAELERDENRECHLYLTDYRSLYVGLVDAIVQDDVRHTDAAHVPAVVDRAVARFHAARARAEAVDRNRDGDLQGARRVLRATARRIREYTGDDGELLELVGELERQAEEYSAGVMDARSLKAAAFSHFAVARRRDPEGKARRSR